MTGQRLPCLDCPATVLIAAGVIERDRGFSLNPSILEGSVEEF